MTPITTTRVLQTTRELAAVFVGRTITDLCPDCRGTGRLAGDNGRLVLTVTHDPTCPAARAAAAQLSTSEHQEETP